MSEQQIGYETYEVHATTTKGRASGTKSFSLQVTSYVSYEVLLETKGKR